MEAENEQIILDKIINSYNQKKIESTALDLTIFVSKEFEKPKYINNKKTAYLNLNIGNKTYITQKMFVLQQYKTILAQYQEQLKQVTNLCKNEKKELAYLEIQYKSGAVSKLNYDFVKTRAENCRLSKEIV